MCGRIHAHGYARTLAHAHAHIREHMHTHAHTHTHTYAHSRTHSQWSASAGGMEAELAQITDYRKEYGAKSAQA